MKNFQKTTFLWLIILASFFHYKMSAQCSMYPSQNNIEFIQSGQTVDVDIYGLSGSCTLTIQNYPSWLNAYKLSSSKIRLVALTYTGPYSEGVVELQADNNTLNVAVYHVQGQNYPENPNNPSISSSGCGESTLLRVNSTDGSVLYWQGKNEFGTNWDAANSTLSYTADQGDGYYFIRGRKNGYWSTKSGKIYVIINEIPDVPLVADKTFCGDGGTVTFTVTNPQSDITYKWYNANTSAYLGSGSSFTTPPMNNTTPYDITAEASNGCIAVLEDIMARNKAAQTIYGEAPQAACGQSQTTLKFNSSPPSGISYSNVSHKWYTSPSGGSPYYQTSSPIFQNSFHTSQLTVVDGQTFTEFYVSATYDSCESNRIPVIAQQIDNSEPSLLILPVSPLCGPSAIFTLNAVGGASDSVLEWYDGSNNYLGSGRDFDVNVSQVGTTTFYLGGTLKNNSGCSFPIAPRKTVEVVLKPTPSEPTITDNSGCGNSTVTFTAGGITGATYRWYSAAGDHLDDGPDFTTDELTFTTDYMVTATVDGCESTQKTIQAVITPIQRWYKDGDNDGIAISQLSCTSPGSGYSLVEMSTEDCDDNLYDPSNNCSTSVYDYNGDNYIYIRNYQTERTQITSFFTEDSDLVQNITYFDGLGRPIQQIGIEQSSADGGNKSDIVTHFGYDNFGRQDKDWLPIPITNSTFGSYHGDISGSTQSYYKLHPDYAQDFPKLSGEDVNSYSQKQFEASPLNRVLKQAAPGEDWKLNYNGEDHSIEFGYFANHQNENNTGDPLNDNVRPFTVGFQDDGTGNDDTEKPLLEEHDFYAQGQLYKNVTRDENHNPGDGKLHTTEEFTDKQGRVVLKRTYGEQSLPNCTTSGSLSWGSTTWSGGSPADDFSSTSSTMVNGVEIVADNSATDFPQLENPSFANRGTVFNGTEGLLLQAPTAQFLDTNVMRYRVSFDRPVADLTFKVVDIDKRITMDGNPYAIQVKITISNGGSLLNPVAGTDYTFGSSVNDLGGGNFAGNAWVNGTAGIGDVVYTLSEAADEIFIEMWNVDIGVTSSTPGNMAILISDISWNCDNSGEPVTEVPYDTYYVYDDYGNLTYVLPPKMDATTASLTTINLQLDELGYQYTYDRRNRLVEKRIPGKDWEYIVYNQLDQPILTQDGNQREKNTTDDEWLFTKYDAFGRVAYTGKAIGTEGTTSTTRSTIQSEVDNLSEPLWVQRGGTADSFGGVPEIFYDNGAYPHNDPNDPSTVDLAEVLTINYYDSYDFLTNNMALPSSVFGKNIVNYDNSENEKTKGLATGSLVKVLGNNEWITSVTAYDEKGRSLYSRTKNEYLETDDIVMSELDFVGKVLKSKTVHSRNGTVIATIDNFTYDPVGRLLSQTQCIGGAGLGEDCPTDGDLDANVIWDGLGAIDSDLAVTESVTIKDAEILPGPNGEPTSVRITDGTVQELIVFNKYDDLGRPESKKVGGTSGIDFGATLGLQEVDYRYNVRGWLTGVNDIASTDKLFNFAVGYTNGDDPLYNGNISNTQWRTANADDSSLKSYDYRYDPLNRIIAATDNTNDYNVTNIGYDKNGNILSLNRNGYQDSSDFSDMDVLDYDYDGGNKLLKVSDTGNKTKGFKDGTNTNDDFEYDINGNLKIDRNKGITGITYNHLDLPEQVNFGSDNIKYVYDATGAKLKRTSSTGTETLYANGYIYEGGNGNAQLQFFGHPEGYIYPDANGNYRYVYNYVDHLGSVRLSYTDADGDGNIDPANEIIEDNAYYPFGLLMRSATSSVSPYGNSAAKRWKYNGKELDGTFDIDTYDFGARNYDPTIGRWMNVDPLADVTLQPYSAFNNNPIYFIDPDGRMAVPPSTHLDDEGNVVAVFDDGDKGVYQHGKNADGGSVTEYQLSKRSEKQGTSSGGTKVGETQYLDEFVSPEDGTTMTNYKVQVGKTFDNIISKMHNKAEDMDLREIASNSAGGGLFDIKKDYKNVGALLNGKYATSRSAGNFLAGYNAEGATYFGAGIEFTTFQKLAGALHIEESHNKRLSFGQKVDIITLGTYRSSDIGKFKPPTYGEVNYQYRQSRAGWKFGESQK